jgi:biopolymer transport protein TolR
MGMSTGKTGNTVSDPNMTPMIDVLLVLLVIFMVAQPMLQRSIDIQLPLESDQNAAQGIPPIILEVMRDGSYQLNTQPIPKNALAQRLAEVFAGRGDKVMFVKGFDELKFGDYMTTMDIAKGAGVEVLGTVLPTGP